MRPRVTESVSVTYRCGCTSTWETTVHDFMRPEDMARVRADMIKRAGWRYCGPCASRALWQGRTDR